MLAVQAINLSSMLIDLSWKSCVFVLNLGKRVNGESAVPLGLSGAYAMSQTLWKLSLFRWLLG
jgi:hypothetical protein